MLSGNKEISTYQTAVMAVAAGICVANIYYNQPLLHAMALSLHVSDSQVGNIAVMAQAGYGLGLFFITPLGDKMNRRKLILLLQVLLVLVLLGTAFAPNIAILMALSLLTGMFSAAAQVILPMAAYMSPKNKGRIVGIIFTGILTGILAARVFCGFIADWLSWRYVYGSAAIMVLVSSLVLYRALPDVEVIFKGSYTGLLQSTLQQLKRFTLLRKTALLGALMFGVFCSFWTTLTFHLSGEPFHYNTDHIGLFGMLAIVSALMAPFFGKMADGGGAQRSRTMAVLMVSAGIIVAFFFSSSLWAVIVAVLLLDLGVQAVQVTNVALIYTLDEKAHSRINTVYMTAYFLGGALGTFTGLLCWKAGGWVAVGIQLAALSVAGLLMVISREKQTDYRKERKQNEKFRELNYEQ